MDNLSFAVPFSSKEPTFCGMKIHFHRNLSGYLFPSKINANDKTKIHSYITSTLKPLIPEALIFEAPLPTSVKETFPDLSSDIKGCLIDIKNSTTYATCDQDHLVVTLHTHNKEFKKLHEEIKTLQSFLFPLFSYAYNPKIGFLTSFPEISGLGLQIEAFLFLPSFENDHQIDECFLLEPYFINKAMYVLKTKQTHSMDLTTLVQKTLTIISYLTNAEAAARDSNIKTNKDQMLDLVCKSLALLKGAHQLNFADTLNHLLNLKLGFHLGFLEGFNHDISLQLLSQAGRSQLAEYFKQKESADDWLHERAEWIKSELKQVQIKP